MKKIFLYLLTLAVLVAAGGFGYLYLRKPNMRYAPQIKLDRTAERIERGKYLFEVAFNCEHCHSETDGAKFTMPAKPDRIGVGQVMPTRQMGVPADLTAPNLTPDPETGSGNWTDGEIVRAIREGIKHDGSVIFPFMPYSEYRHMSDEDVYSIVAYIRSMAPVKNPLPKSKVDFPFSLLIKSEPRVVEGVPNPDRADKVAYGRYLATNAGCKFCHTPVDGEMHNIPGKEFSGGHEFGFGDMKAVSYNLTPDPDTGTGKWSEQEFIEKFRQYADYAEHGAPEVKPESFTVMGWLAFSQMKTEDLSAIFTYLRTVPAIRNSVETHPVIQK
jgi:hypothetical protein